MSNTNPLTRDGVVSLARSINRLHSLNQQAIKTADSDAEIQSLTDIIAHQLTFHAAEFINAWLCVTDEYAPLVGAFASLQTRAANMVQMRAAQIAATEPAKAPQPAPGSAPAPNIIVPPEFKKGDA